MRYLMIAATCLATQSAFADVPFDGYADTYAEIVNHVACFPHGIDMIGRGEVEAGVAVWNECWGEDLVSRLGFVSASITCPGEDCVFLAGQPDLRGPAMRGALAQIGFDMMKLHATHHQLDTLRVEFDGPENAIVSGMITATHFSDHQGPETHFIHWTGKVVKTDIGWRITEEDLRTAGHSILPHSE